MAKKDSGQGKGSIRLPAAKVPKALTSLRSSSQLRSIASAASGPSEYRQVQRLAEWLDLAQQTALFVLYDWNPQTDTIEWSGDVEQVWGLPSEKWEGGFATWKTLVHPEDLSKVSEAIEGAFSRHCPYEFDYRVCWPDGSTHWLCSRGKPTKYNKSGKPIRVIGINQLIDNRKREDEQLRHRTEELEKLMDLAPAALWVAHDPQCHDITGNKMANQFYEAVDGENVSASPSSGEQVQQRRFFCDGRELKPEELPMQAAITDGINVRDAELEVVLPSGKRFTMFGSACPLRGPEGEIRGSVAAFVDITKHKRAEERLRESELRFRSMFERHKAVMMLIEPITGEIVAANTAAVAFYGYSREVLQSLRVQDINALSPEEVNEERQQALTQCRNYFVFPHRMADGSIRWVEVYSSPIVVQERPLLFSMIHDITDRKRAQDALRTSEEHFRILVEQASDGIFVSDAEGHYLDVNSAGCEMLGYSRHEILGLTISDLVAPDEVPRIPGEVARLDGGQVARSEWRFRRKDGSVFHGEVVGRRLPDGRLQGILRDITERKRSQESLIRSEKLASAGRLAATIAHEINNPLAAAINLLYLAQLDHALSGDTRQFLVAADEELRRATEITRQTLGFYRESGHPEPVCLRSVADAVLDLYTKRINNKGISVRRKHRNSPPALAVTGEVRQVVANLVANAVDASSRGGILHLRTSHVGELVVITVADTGVGIGREQKKHIFEPFYTTKENIGTGLGLWVSSEIIKKHGGHIRMRSKAGKGSVFVVYLPQTPPQQKLL